MKFLRVFVSPWLRGRKFALVRHSGNVREASLKGSPRRLVLSLEGVRFR